MRELMRLLRDALGAALVVALALLWVYSMWMLL